MRGLSHEVADHHLWCYLTTLGFCCATIMLTPGREVQAEWPGSREAYRASSKPLLGSASKKLKHVLDVFHDGSVRPELRVVDEGEGAEFRSQIGVLGQHLQRTTNVFIPDRDSVAPGRIFRACCPFQRTSRFPGSAVGGYHTCRQ